MLPLDDGLDRKAGKLLGMPAFHHKKAKNEIPDVFKTHQGFRFGQNLSVKLA
jgi:hypothetical protein